MNCTVRLLATMNCTVMLTSMLQCKLTRDDLAEGLGGWGGGALRRGGGGGGPPSPDRNGQRLIYQANG